MSRGEIERDANCIVIGARLHWMTTGDLEWTGLPDDNAVIEPLNRRGPKPKLAACSELPEYRLAIAEEPEGSNERQSSRGQ